jgi:large repetitive protein
MKIVETRAWIKRMAATAMLILASMTFATQAQAQHTSTECPAQTGTVTSGGTVTIDISDCEFVFRAGGIGDIDGGSSGPADFENHGTATTRHASGRWFLDYSHNGSTGIGSTDVFELSDGSATGNGDILFTITINAATSPLTVTPGALPTLTAGTNFSQTLTTTGGTAPYSYTLQSGALPPGVSLSSGGVLSGSPTQRGAYSFSVRSTDSTAPTANFVDKGYTGSVQNPSLSLAANSGTAIQSVSFSQTLVTNGGVAPYAYQIETGSLPAGISLSSGGVISGTTTAAPGNYPVTIRVTDSSTGPGTYFELESYTLTVSPPPTVSIAVSPASLNEDGAGNATVTVTRSLNLSSATLVNITTSGTATSGTDYSGAVSTISIPAGATTATFTIDPTVDSAIEGDETAIFTVAAGTGYTVGSPASATLTINNDDFATATIALSPSSVFENGTDNLVYTVTLSQAAASPISVNFTLGGSATNGTDYTAVTSPLVIAAGSTSGTITINPTGDTANESDESVTVTLAAGAGYTVGAPNSASGTILNDDGTSTFCPSLSATVAWGGNVSIDAGSCNAGFGLGTVLTPPAHGSATVGAFGANQPIIYTHNGATGTTDTFTVNDGEAPPNNQIRVNITILPPTSAITISPSSLPALQAGTAFSQSFSSSGGSAPYSYSVFSGTLPPGISLSAGGVLSGTPSQRGAYSFTIRSLDSLGASADRGYSGTVAVPTLTLATPSGTAFQGVAFTQTLSTTGGIAPYSYLLETGTLPAGITLSSAGVLSGTTSAAPGNFPVTIRVTDSSTGPGQYFELESYILTVSPPPSVSIGVAPASVSEDGAANLVYTVTRTLNLSSPTVVNLTASGTATAGTDYSGAAATVTIAAGATTATLTIDPTADTVVEADETVTLTIDAGAGYSVGSPASATATILNDDLPTLSINDVTVTEGNSGTVNAVFTVSLSAPAGSGGVSFDIATANGTATAGTDYVAQTLTAQTIAAGSSSYSFTVAVNGDVLNEAGETFFVNIANVTGATVADGQGLGTITNDDPFPDLSINDVTVTEGNSGTVNAVFTVSLSAASGQTVSVNYATADGIATQPGDYSSTTGTLTFTPGTTTQTVTVAVSGEAVPEADETFFVNLSGATNASISDNQGLGTITNDDVPVALSPTTLANGSVAAAYSATLTASGGAAPYGFAVTSGALPAGLTLSPSGNLTGIPTAGGNFTFTVTATDSSAAPGPFTGSQAYTLTIDASVIILPATTLSGGTLGQAYSATITGASGGTAPYSYAITGGALPGGLSLNAVTGAITGTPSAFGTFNFVITATDSSTGSGPYSMQQNYVLVITDQVPVAAASSLTVAYNAPATNVPLALTGGAPTSLTIVTTPANGVAAVSGTTISYQPTSGFSGSDSFTYVAVNGGGTSAAATVSISVGAPTLTITPGGPLAATVGQAYSQTFTFAGGTAPFGSYQVTGLPSGLAVTATSANSVTIDGTPRSQGSFTLGVSGADSSTGSGPFTANQSFALTVGGPNLALAPASGTFNATYATPFSQLLAASGGIGPYSYAVSGALPAGIGFNAATGTLSGAPTATGNFAFSITATDTGATGAGAPFTVVGNYTLAIAAPTITVTPAALPAATSGQAYSATLTASGAVGPYVYTLIGGALPTGVTLSRGGQLAGTPTASGSFAFTVGVTDANGQSGSAALTLNVAVPVLTLTPATLPAAFQNIAYSQSLTVSGGVAPYGFTLSSGALPAGLTLNPTTGVIGGTPTASGAATFAITVTDSTSGTRAALTATYTLQVTARPDPANDPEVRGLVRAQVDATRRFADAQVDNFMQRMENMHGEGNDAGGDGTAITFRNSVRIATLDYCRDALTMMTNAACENRARVSGIIARAARGQRSPRCGQRRPWCGQRRTRSLDGLGGRRGPLWRPRREQRPGAAGVRKRGHYDWGRPPVQRRFRRRARNRLWPGYGGHWR